MGLKHNYTTLQAGWGWKSHLKRLCEELSCGQLLYSTWFCLYLKQWWNLDWDPLRCSHWVIDPKEWSCAITIYIKSAYFPHLQHTGQTRHILVLPFNSLHHYWQIDWLEIHRDVCIVKILQAHKDPLILCKDISAIFIPRRFHAQLLPLSPICIQPHHYALAGVKECPTSWHQREFSFQPEPWGSLSACA